MDAMAIASGSSKVTFRKPGALSDRRPVSMAEQRRFKVAVSFPGEIRETVEKTVRQLQARLGKEAIFYDKDHEAELACPDLDLRLLETYRDNTDLIVAFLAPDYTKKQWCGLEWRSIRELLKTGRDADIMFLRMKDAPLPPGMLSIDGYADISDSTESQVANLILKRLKRPPGKNRF
jgi:hypothetical protein